jgi:hypothetical protein
MTARHQVRVGARIRERDEPGFVSQRAPHVGELLVVARERKGVTLERAERETKIRARHLAALENDDATSLPAPVYAKGFLRNYALYLGLDPDEMVMRWRNEQETPRRPPAIAVEPPPQPIMAPGRGFVLTPGIIVAAVLTLVAIAFAGYVLLQLVRFTQNPAVVLDRPSVVELSPEATTFELSGTGTPGALVSVHGAGDLLRTSTADEAGRWSVELPVSKGRNDFSVSARDPETGRETSPLQVIATVPVKATPSPSPQSTPRRPASGGTLVPGVIGPVGGLDTVERETAVLAVSQPQDGLVADDGKVRVVGATDAESVLVTLVPIGRGDGRAPWVPEPATLPVEEGAFAGRLVVPEGRWEVTVETLEPGGRVPAVVARKIRARFEGLVVTVTSGEGRSRIRVTVDGVLVDSDRLRRGESRSYRASEEVIVHTGNSRNTSVTVNGRSFGAMGDGPGPGAWRLREGKPPVPVP